jgi:Na+-transporting NADH:ubiquinone oxidoreductase subunit A
MNAIHLKKGFSPPIAGAPSRQLRLLDAPRHVGMVPEHIPFIKPRLLIQEGDPVAIGSPLFEDKRDTRIRFLSPGGGQVTRIVFGPRRVIRQIIIALDSDERMESFEVPAADKLDALPREAVVEILLAGGVWPFFRALPFMDVADPDTVPPTIIVRLGDDEPFAPDPAVYLKDREDLFGQGIALIKKLCDRVVVNHTGDETVLQGLSDQTATRRFSGCYPAGNPSVQLYRTRTGADQNRSWFIDGQDVIQLGEFLRTGRYPIRRVVSIGGTFAPLPEHVSTRAGLPLRLLCGPLGEPAARYIVGGVLTGFSSGADGFMGFYQNALNLIDDGDREEPFGFIRPGYGKPSYSTAFLSAFRRKPFPMDCGQHGEVRACVNCGTCATICPVDILPQFTMKCLVADEVEEALAHGLLDCAECGLCTYACPSKIQLREVFRAAKAQYYKEIA